MTVYRWGQITFVPHYDGTGYYVGPGYPKQNTILWKPDDLKAIGAQEATAFLWHRPKFSKVV